MELQEINCVLLDKDGVLMNGNTVLPGAQEFVEQARKNSMPTTILSNTSRLTGQALARVIREKIGVSDLKDEEVVTAVDVTMQYLREHPSRERPEDVLLHVVGEDGFIEAMQDAGFAVANDQWKNGNWAVLPTDVVNGLDTHSTYEKLAPAWNAVRLGARLISVNSDRSYRSASGAELPAAGAQLAYLATAKENGRPDIVLGKPNVEIAEVALGRMHLSKTTARIAVIGDNLREDMGLATQLNDAGWKAEGWMMLTGVTAKDQCNHAAISRVFMDLRETMKALFSQR
ncbi:MAG: HAD-IIA family hydrolase [Candidatus Peribacter sp.]|nr:HAD-IIA family hydrolase [Candidatus Peribacter sp.]